MNRRTVRLLCILASAMPLILIPGIAQAGISARHTAAVSSTPRVPVRYYQYRAIDKTYEGRHTGDWRVCGHGVNATNINGVTFTCSESVTVTTTESVTGGYTVTEISGSMGFSISVSYAYSTSLGLTVPLPKHTQANIDFGIYYSRYRAGMEKRLCVYPSDTCLPWSRPSWVTVQRAIAPAIGAFNERPA
jgi:hypothetical protein